MSIKIEGEGSKENVFSDSDSGMPLWNGAPLLNLVYPVGSIYWSSNNTNPSTLFGGTWTQIKDRFILAAGDSYTNGAIGGAATVTLTVSNMPSHKHSFTPSGTISINGDHTHLVYFDLDDSIGSANSFAVNQGISRYHELEGTSKAGSHRHDFSGTAGNTDSSGSGSSFSILPPYVVKYCWERIA